MATIKQLDEAVALLLGDSITITATELLRELRELSYNYSTNYIQLEDPNGDAANVCYHLQLIHMVEKQIENAER